ncbi:MAG: glycosyltransferase family 4 protein [Sodalis sp. (in: enterobacteria)]|uniref:glycosyltransferase family 4 protein n=1 Tax=Sodalis sp. (in: enterobacteria) TaxID=1898979 RepID=UPI0039E4D0C5
MHILIDVQGLQSASKYRGIGRSTLAMSRAIIRNAGEHRVSILLNGMFSLDNIREVRQAYQDVLPANEIYTFSAQGPVAACDAANAERNRAAHISRDVAIAHINPDVVFVISFFEGHVDEYIVSIPDYPVKWRTVCVCHDLIPLLNPETYLADINFRQFYTNKLHEYERADAIFAISASAAEEVKKYTAIDPSRVINISSAVEPEFRVLSLTPEQKQAFRQRYHLPDTFMMTLAMIEPRKNIEALIEAYSQLPETLRNDCPMVLACKIRPAELAQIQRLCAKCGLTSEQVLFTGYLPDSDLITLYNLCKLFIFPSLHEGFGLPPLEAMSCGAPTLSSNATSLPEVIGWSEAMFDPTSIQAMRDSMLRALEDEDFYQRLQDHALTQAAKFSWDRTAHLALAGFERIMTSQVPSAADTRQFTAEAIRRLAEKVTLNQETDRLGVAWALAQNAFSEQTPRLWVDATTLMAQGDTAAAARTRRLITTLLAAEPSDYSVHVVYCLHNSGYRYAVVNPDGRLAPARAQDVPVLFTQQDVLLVAEPQDHVSARQQAELDALIRAGTQVVFWLPDDAFAAALLAAPQEACPPEGAGLRAMFRYADSILCSSGAIAAELQRRKAQWANEIALNTTLQIDSLEADALPAAGDEIHQLIARLQLAAPKK